jgi:predicted ATPase/DNA-binding XRE family transcriptional regulator
MDPTTSFGSWLRYRRRVCDLTQDVLARRVGCALITIQKIEADERRPSKEMAARLADVLDVPTDERALFLKVARGELAMDRLERGVLVHRLPVDQPLHPAAMTPILGREQELGRLADLLELRDCRLLTLVGTGGVGKTRLALQAAADLAGSFADGVAFVALEAIVDPSLVPAAIARVLGVAERGAQPLLDTLAARLREREMLLVLDNFEQVLPAATVVSTLLRTVPKLTVLVTSRTPLHLYAEHVFEVSPLETPDLHQLPDPATLMKIPAVALFVGRTQALKSEFVATPTNLPTIAAICARLNGLPLAIELAAARCKLLTPVALLDRLDEQLRILAASVRDIPERQHTMRATIEWSYSLLTPAQQRLFARLAVFAGGWTLEAAEAISAEDDLGVDVLDGLQALVDHSVVQVVRVPLTDRAATGDYVERFRWLETIREFAHERLEATGGREALRQRHARYFLHVVEVAEHMQSGPAQREALELFECELENLRAAFSWALESGDSELCLRLATAPACFWGLRTPMQEGYQWLAAALAHDDAQYQATGSQAPPAVRAGAMLAQVEPAIYLGHHSDVPALLEQALRLYTAVDDKPGMAAILTWQATMDWNIGGRSRVRKRLDQALELARAGNDPGTLGHVLRQIGFIALFHREYGTARTALNEALTIFRAQGNTWGVAEALQNLAGVARDLGDFARANELYQEALVLASDGGETIRRAWILHGWGEAALLEGDYAAARTREQESLMLFRQAGNTYGIAHALHNLGYAEQHLGDTIRTLACFSECLTLFRALEEAWGIPASLSGLGGVAVMYAQQRAGEARLEQAQRAARLLGAADGLNEASGMGQWPSHQAELEYNLAAARALLAPEVFEATWAEGRGMTLEQAVAYALDNTDVIRANSTLFVRPAHSLGTMSEVV